jgi:hypothetical protein
MAKSNKVYPPEFRRQMVEPALRARTRLNHGVRILSWTAVTPVTAPSADRSRQTDRARAFSQGPGRNPGSRARYVSSDVFRSPAARNKLRLREPFPHRPFLLRIDIPFGQQLKSQQMRYTQGHRCGRRYT